MGGHKTSRFLHLPAGILKVIERPSLALVSHIYCLDGLSNVFCNQCCVLGTGVSVEMVGRTYIPRTGEEVGSL